MSPPPQIWLWGTDLAVYLKVGSLSEGRVPVIFISLVSIHQIDHKTLAIGPIVLELENWRRKSYRSFLKSECT